MSTRRDDEYQNPHDAGSLSSALKSWQSLRTADEDAGPNPVVFTLSCWSESRANRVARFLRRRAECAGTRVHNVAGAKRDTWHVHGSTHPEMQSLPRLESVWTWLRLAAHSHQVELLRISVAA